MNRLILHAYDASPFTQRVLRVLGIKDLDWCWVETPMLPPKDDLLALTGGYRGTPVMQIGSDIFVDSKLIALELERRYPQPSLFPAADPGMAVALTTWSDALFRQALLVIVAVSSHAWPAEFRKDREELFPDVDFQCAAAGLAHAKSQYRALAALLERQLADGREFLGGAHPGFADAFVHPFVWVMRGSVPAIAAELLDDFPHIRPWEERVAARGEGRRRRIDPSVALAEAKATQSETSRIVDRHDAQGLIAGMRVCVTPDDTRRGAVTGDVVAASAEEIVILRIGESTGPVVLHFPRAGYRVTPVTADPTGPAALNITTRVPRRK
jgi:glutathione S-transferase